MTPVQGFDLHPGAAQDIDDIWTFIAADSPVAAGRVRANRLIAIQKLALSPYVGHLRTDLAAGHLRFFRVYEIPHRIRAG